MWQLANEADNLFDAIISDMGVTINYATNGQDRIPSISSILRPCAYPYGTVHFFLSSLWTKEFTRIRALRTK
jgi:hypothetical protein